MAKLWLAAPLALGAALVFSGTVWAADSARASSTATGNDVSYPQCKKSLPTGQAFGIVGVNGGIANNFNSCFSTELAWALRSPGTGSQPPASLYVNTGNPGNLGVADWPTNNISADPYTPSCTGGDNQACAWQYGWNMAFLDAGRVPSPAQYVWWLDVETANSWESNTANNDAALEGMVAYFQSINVKAVGVYCTSYQWGKIAGTPSATSSLNSLADWIPGARTLSGAQSNCKLRPFTTGGHVAITQWVKSAGSVDSDYACP